MKNKSANRILAAILGAALTGSLLVSCSADSATAEQTENTGAAESTEQTENTAAEAAEATNDGEIKVIHIVTGGGPAPYISLDENNELQGFDIAVIKEVFDRLPQYELEWTIADDGLTGLLSGIYDISVGNWAYRDERAESYYYSFPYKLTDKVFVQRADDTPLESLQDAADRGYKIDINAGGPVTDALERWNEEHPDAQIDLTYSDAEIVVKYQHVADGQFDFAIDDGPLVSNVIAAYGFTDIVANEITDEALQEVFPKVYTYFLIRKDEEGASLREDVDEVLKELLEDGTLEALSQEYFSKDVTPPADQFETPLN